MVLRAVKFNPSTKKAYKSDLFQLVTAQVKNRKRIVFLKVDNGPDSMQPGKCC